MPAMNDDLSHSEFDSAQTMWRDYDSAYKEFQSGRTPFPPTPPRFYERTSEGSYRRWSPSIASQPNSLTSDDFEGER